MTEVWGKIGSAAGAVYTSFVGKSPATAAEVKKKTKLDDAMLYMALGWLAREGKAHMTTEKNTLMVKILE